MREKLTLQTASALERIQEALLGNTQDDLDSLIIHLDQLSKKAKEIHNVLVSDQSGIYD